MYFKMIATLITLLCILHVAAGGSRAVCLTQPIKVVEGETAALHCGLHPPVNLSCYTVDWKRVDNKQIVYVYRDGRDDPDSVVDQYRGRTTINHEDLSRGTLTLNISSANLSDSTSYKCFVPKLETWCEVRLIVVPKDQQNWTKTDVCNTTGPAVEEDHGAVKRTAVLLGVLPVVVLLPVVFVVAALLLWKYEVIEKCKKKFRGKKTMSNNFEMENLSTGPTEGDDLPSA
ncbi:myelin-oligodendrocyte glycoprotein-like [Cebidichthys violaceus]|uniref:myelin-oligodendrocyte glycoprotein-like n=1 Tax=Cebidichthys violaceus TaxID=271503 RepID=UPI0035C9E50E